MFALNLLSTAPLSYLVSPRAHVYTVTTLTCVSRLSVALTSALLVLVSLSVLAGALLLVGGITLFGIAHRHAGYSPLLSGPTPSPQLALLSAEMRGDVIHGPSLPSPVTIDSCDVNTPTRRNVIDLTEFEKSTPIRLTGGGTQVRPSTQYGNDLHSASMAVLRRAAKARGMKGYTGLRKPALVELLTREGLTYEDVSAA